jgi:hypothetical protein
MIDQVGHRFNSDLSRTPVHRKRPLRLVHRPPRESGPDPFVLDATRDLLRPGAVTYDDVGRPEPSFQQLPRVHRRSDGPPQPHAVRAHGRHQRWVWSGPSSRMNGWN